MEKFNNCEKFHKHSKITYTFESFMSMKTFYEYEKVPSA